MSKGKQKTIYLYSASDATVDLITNLVMELGFDLQIEINCKDFLMNGLDSKDNLCFFDFNNFQTSLIDKVEGFYKRWVFISYSEFIHEQVFRSQPFDVINLEQDYKILVQQFKEVYYAFDKHNTVYQSHCDSECKISISSISGEDYVFDIDDIKYIQAAGDYCDIILYPSEKGIQKEKVTVKGNLKYLENWLPNRPFYRIHKSYVVNLNWVRELHEYPKNEVYLKDGKSLPLARRKKLEFFNEYRVVSALSI